MEWVGNAGWGRGAFALVLGPRQWVEESFFDPLVGLWHWSGSALVSSCIFDLLHFLKNAYMIAFVSHPCLGQYIAFMGVGEQCRFLSLKFYVYS